ncbi:MAG: ADP-ribosylglycohydrolase family protein [Patescibacteria group bacterium]
MTNTLLDRFKGCLIGLAVGDYLGLPIEFCKASQVKNFYPNGLEPRACTRGNSSYPAGFYTDDTALTICLAESLIENGFDVKDQFLRYKKWLMEGYATPFNDNAYGVGQNTLRQLLTADPDNLPTEMKNNEKQGGNGALMKCSPIGLRYYKDEKELVEKTIASTIITHTNEIAVWCCIAHNLFISYSLYGYAKETFIERFLSTYQNCHAKLQEVLQMDFSTVDEHSLSTSGYSLNTFIISLYCFVKTDNYKDCITKAIFLGGDADTQGAVAGSLAGCYYGYSKIPKSFLVHLMKKSYVTSLSANLCSRTKKEQVS